MANAYVFITSDGRGFYGTINISVNRIHCHIKMKHLATSDNDLLLHIDTLQMSPSASVYSRNVMTSCARTTVRMVFAALIAIILLVVDILMCS